MHFVKVMGDVIKLSYFVVVQRGNLLYRHTVVMYNFMCGFVTRKVLNKMAVNSM
jgi:hypothetical protein